MLHAKSFRRLLLLAVLAAAPRALAQEQDPAARIIDRIVAGEQAFLDRMKPLRPMLETYIQEFTETPGGPAMPVRDHYMLGRLDLSNGVGATGMALSSGFQKRSGFFGKGGSVVFNPAGWAQMTIPDAYQFNRATYQFEFSRREFLGEVRCLVFDVSPKDRKAPGRFIGRIWVEDRDFRIVRFNGTYTMSKSSSLYFHFDSWRVNAEPGFWVPAIIYIEESDPVAQEVRRPRFKAQTRLWGYRPQRAGRLEELASIQVEEAPVKDQSGSTDISPVESQRSWERLAEDNVTDWLQKNGLLAPKSEVDQVLTTVVNNLLVTNRLNADIRCRVLLTTPLETFSVGQTIVISRGFLDVLPDEASLAMVLAGELSHIVLGHRTRTAYAFGDQTQLSDQEALNRLRFDRTPQEIEEAGKKTVELLLNSPYKDKLAGPGLFLKAVSSRSSALTHLVRANLGNQFASSTNLQALNEIISKAPALDESRIDQIAALPLGSRIRLEPWSNRISLIKTGPLTFLSVREKMPLEVTPVALHLTRAGVSAEGRSKPPEKQGN